MTAAVRIVAAGPDDAVVVRAVMLAAFAPYADLDPPSGALRETVDGVRAELAEHGGAIAYAGTVPVGSFRFAEHDGAVFARRVAVLPEWQRRGVGRALVAWAEEEARRRGATELRLGVRAALGDNRDFYARLGYREVAEHLQPDGRPFWVELAKPLGYAGPAYGEEVTAVAEPTVDITTLCRQARDAATEMALLPRATKDAALHAMAAALLEREEEILVANVADVQHARSAGVSDAIVDRLALTTARLRDMADGLRDVAALPDPVGEVVRGSTLANGLELRQLRVPLGVVGVIYEARPNVTVDAAGICVKSGNAVLLRGSSSAAHSNNALVRVVADAGAAAGLPKHTVQLVPATDHESVKQLMRARGLVDVLIPRGGAGLIRSVVEESTVPVVETGVGNCHVYVDEAADLDTAVDIVVNAKCSRPSVCNAAETLLVHEAVAAEFLPKVLEALRANGVTVHGDAAVSSYADNVVPVTDDDWYAEYLSLDIAAGVVPSLAAAVAHIRRYGSGHTEAIVTRSQEAARRFTATVDSAAVMVNASTRFTDGAEFGFGAEIGISTQKLHARGPMGLPELTSTKYVVVGDGHVR